MASGSVGLTPTGLAIDVFLSGLGNDTAARHTRRRLHRFVQNFTERAKAVHRMPNPTYHLLLLRQHAHIRIHTSYYYLDWTLRQLLLEYVRELTTAGWRPSTRTQVALRQHQPLQIFM
jgi:hypothetical protein